MPADAGSGERYGVIWAELASSAPPSGGISTVNRVGVRLYLSIGAGGEPPTDFAITSLEARRADDGAPMVAAQVRNTGGRTVDLSGELRLSGGPGGLSAGPFPARLGATLAPGEEGEALVPLDRAVPDGPWEASIALRSGTTEREARAKITFPVGQARSAGRVAVESTGSSGDTLWRLAAGLVLAVSILLLLTGLRRRRRPEPAPASRTP